jgi:hypothetical protein
MLERNRRGGFHSWPAVSICGEPDPIVMTHDGRGRCALCPRFSVAARPLAGPCPATAEQKQAWHEADLAYERAATT